MSISTIVGFLLGVLLVVGSVVLSTNNYLVFLELAGSMMVVGGTLASTFVAYEPRYVILALKLIPTIFFQNRVGRGVLMGEVGRIIRWGYLVQKSGLSALEADAKKVGQEDKLLGYGVDIVSAGHSGHEVREMMLTAVNTSFQRSTVPAEILKTMGSNCPAFGMIATLVGLVVMLDKMGSDPSKIGAGMAVGLMGTLYGVLLARLVLLPTASKVQQRQEIIRFRNLLVAEGMALLAERKSPRYIQDRMNSFLDPVLHVDTDKVLNRGK